MKIRFQTVLTVIYSIVIILIAWLDPFGVGVSAETSAEALAQRVLASSYPTAGASHIVIAMLSPATVSPGNEDLLPTYADHAALINIASEAGVVAIFDDTSFLRRPAERDAPELSELGTALAHAKAHGIPVFTGPVLSFPALAPLMHGSSRTGVSWHADHPADYALFSNGMRTAAADLYIAACSRRPAWGECDPTLMDRLADAPQALAPIAMRFGSNAPVEEDNVAGTDFGHCRASTFASAVWDGLRGRVLPAPCPSQLTIPTAVLKTFGGDPGLQDDLRGRVLFIGVGTEMGDDHEVPGVGVVPGVRLHAMALDNLLTWGMAYYKWSPAWRDGWALSWEGVIKAMLAIAIPLAIKCFINLYKIGSRKNLSKRKQDVRRILSFYILLVAIIFTLSFLFFDIALWPAGVIILICGTATLAGSILSGEEFDEATRGFGGAIAFAFIGGLLGIAAFALLMPMPPLRVIAILALVIAVNGGWLVYQHIRPPAQSPIPPPA